MGAVTKVFKKVTNAVGGLTKKIGGLVSGAPKAPDILLPAPAPTPAVQVEAPPQEKVELETAEGTSNETATRRGKAGLTIKRSQVGGGTGLNV